MTGLLELINVGVASEERDPQDEFDEDCAHRPHIYRCRVMASAEQQFRRAIPSRKRLVQIIRTMAVHTA